MMHCIMVHSLPRCGIYNSRHFAFDREHVRTPANLKEEEGDECRFRPTKWPEDYTADPI